MVTCATLVNMLSDAYFELFESQKYRNDNPLQRMLIRRFVAKLHAMFVAACPLETVLEIGVGQGFLSGYLSERFPEVRFTGVDLNGADLDHLRRNFPRIEAHEGDVFELSFLGERTFDLVICAEVLEHLETPAVALDQMGRFEPRHAILTVPHEPYFMLSNLLRGKNVTRFGNDIEHVNHWGTSSFRKLLEQRFDVLELTTAYPWMLALVQPRR